jgi:hypothetical protein
MLTDILKYLNTIRPDHDKVEIRCIGGRGGAILTGEFDREHRKEIPAAVAPYSDWDGIYFCMNAPNLPATNKLDHGTAVNDKDISRRVAFMFDFDPVRRGLDGKVLREPALKNELPVLHNDGNPRMKKMEVSSTAEEKTRAVQCPLACGQYLTDSGLPGLDDIPVSETRSLAGELMRARIEGFAPGVEDLYLNWDARKNWSGRDTYHVLKVAIITALLQGHKRIEMSDWGWACVFMEWQGRVRSVFQPGNVEDDKYARFAEKIMKAVIRHSEKMVAGGKEPKDCFIRWRALANNGDWWRSAIGVQKQCQI